jgi:hypothetical protein
MRVENIYIPKQLKIRILFAIGAWHHQSEDPGAYIEVEESVLRKYEFKCWKEIVSYLILMCGIALMLNAFYIDATLSLDQQSNPVYWFQRSGAILVAVSLFAEYSLHRGPSQVWAITATPLFLKIRQIVRFVGFLFAAIGTLIWAYGDLPFRSIN